jgi:hypothetical protein
MRLPPFRFSFVQIIPEMSSIIHPFFADFRPRKKGPELQFLNLQTPIRFHVLLFFPDSRNRAAFNGGHDIVSIAVSRIGNSFGLSLVVQFKNLRTCCVAHPAANAKILIYKCSHVLIPPAVVFPIAILLAERQISFTPKSYRHRRS